MPNRWESLRVGAQQMRAYLATPEGRGPHPGLVVIHSRWGLDEFALEMVDRSASEGYVAIAPDLFHREDSDAGQEAEGRSQRLRDELVVQDVNGAIDFLEKHEEVEGLPIGIMGFCMGGRVTYLIAVSTKKLKAAAVFYGGGIMRPSGNGPSPFALTENIQCPILGLFGLEDQNPSPDDVKKIQAELTRFGKVHEFHSYEDTGHAFMNSRNTGYREHAAHDAWIRTTAWFEQHLRTAAPAGV